MKPRVSVLMALVLAMMATAPSHAQMPTLEYQVKAAYLLNFLRYVEWPDAALGDGPMSLCVAGRNPFGTVLEETVRGERIGGKEIAVRVILEPEPGCHAMFVPRGAAASAYLRSVRNSPALTVGEAPDFIAQGGIVNFVLEGPNVRFEIDQTAAERSQLRISSRLLRLARPLAGARGAS